ncbi:MAG: sugar phosphate isomerase/epimerase [Bryobacteraceae bacterium]|jgi:sugar phosphate isomerase/epimerase|nr:sugar phosphate isomerase/epimerase [Bryobacteraceae bacterium]
MYTRRTFGAMAVCGLAARAAKIDSRIAGVMIGAQSYSFRDRSLEEALAAYKEVGLGYCELWSGHVEPRKLSREELRNWRLTVSLDHFRSVRKKFDEAGVELYAYNYSFRDDFTDEEIARGFEIAQALGVRVLTASANVSTAKRIDPHAARARIRVGMHNHSNLRPNEFARPEDFEEAMRGASPYIAINLDIGHFVAAGYDPVDFLARHHDKIVTLHIKDRKKNQGPNVPFGEGDTPIREVLQLLKARKLAIPAMIEYEYPGQDTIAEVRRCFEYCKKALA